MSPALIPVLTAEDVKRHDAEAEAQGVSVDWLMENAGWAVARTAREMLEGTYGRRIVVISGKGNNGGDGLVAARRLMEMGAHVTVVPVFAESSMNALATKNLERFRGSVRPLSELAKELDRADLVIDAIFGVGLTRAPEGEARVAIETLTGISLNHYPPPVRRVLSVDVPSGLNSDTGETPGVAVNAERTVTFLGYKPGLLFAPTSVGRVTIDLIGIPWHWIRTKIASVDVLLLKQYLDLIARGPDGDKRKAGTALIVAGSSATPGAAALCAAAAMHAGAGLTTLCAPEEVCRLVVSRVPELTTIPIPADAEGVIGTKALDILSDRLTKFDAVAIGPGLGTAPQTQEAIRSLVRMREGLLVLDADGLNAYEGRADELTAHEGPLLITPHAGELSRLLGVPRDELERDRVGAAVSAARDLRCTVLFKGIGTVIANGNAGRVVQVFINPTGGPGLAQGGTGDVLTGMLCGLFAQLNGRARTQQSAVLDPVLPPLEGASAHLVAVGAWLHGRAADRIAQRLWPHPANASALIEEIGPTMHEVMGHEVMTS